MARAPLALHPRNPRYFLFRGGPAVLVTSGEHYGALLNLDFDYRAYLAELERHGLNLTRVFAGTYREVPGSFNITDNPLAPLPGRFCAPWARTGVPYAFDGEGKFDLARWNPAYFARLRTFMREASRRGVVVEFNLFCPFYDEVLWQANPMNAWNNVNGVGRCPRHEVFTLAHRDLTAVQAAVTRKLVRELAEFDNLYFEVMNEPYAGGVGRAWQDRIVREIARAERPLRRKHLISLNVANHRARVVRPNPRVSLFNFHYCVPPDVVAMNRRLGKPVGENETGFRGRKDVTYRTEGWDFLLAGGALYNNLDYSFSTRHPRGTLAGYRSPGGGSRALRRQLGRLKRFVESFDFASMRPDPRVIRAGLPRGWSARALARRGVAYAVYLHAPAGREAGVVFRPNERRRAPPRPVRRRLNLRVGLPPGRYEAVWLDPATGRGLGRARVTPRRGIAGLVSPGGGAAAALAIRRRA